MVTVIINRHLSTTIFFHDMFYGFWVGRNTGTTYLKVKLIKKLTEMR